jgi:serpin B
MDDQNKYSHFSQMGMAAMFSSSEADLSGMTSDGPRLFVSNVIQKTYLKLDKEGTEAAAATSMFF